MNSVTALEGIEKARIIERDQHPVSRKNISPNALKVLYRLSDNGFAAFLVGGGVRDVLLGKQPKDFDIATDATPEQVRELFRNARIIGRRFKIVHIRYGREIIETTTFRAHHEQVNEIQDNVSRRQITAMDSAHSTGGMILRDNVYGNIDEDAMRRDFTVNALYYTTDGFRILDFCNGLQDLEARKLRMIGDPEARYREDPVRMLRAIRFAAKLEFTIEEKTEAPIDELAPLLSSISPARLFDETLKLLCNGHARATFTLLCKYRVGEFLLTPTIEALDAADEISLRLVELALDNTDDRLAQGKSVTPAFLFAALLWPVLQLKLQRFGNAEQISPQQYHQAANDSIMEQLQCTAIPKRFTIASREIWDLQRRLQRRNKRNVFSLLNHPRFRAAYDFLLLREEAGEDLQGLGAWWTEIQKSDTNQQNAMIAAVEPTTKRRRRRRKKPSGKSE